MSDDHDDITLPGEDRLNEKQRKFLHAYMDIGVIDQALRSVPCSLNSHGWWLKEARNREAYAAAWEVAHEVGSQILVTEAHRRAVVGDRIYKFHKGHPIIWKNPETGQTEHYYESVRSDFLLMKLLEAHIPDEFRPAQKHEHSGELHVVRVKLDRGQPASGHDAGQEQAE